MIKNIIKIKSSKKLKKCLIIGIKEEQNKILTIRK
jgi:hypothetical protein